MNKNVLLILTFIFGILSVSFVSACYIPYNPTLTIKDLNIDLDEIKDIGALNENYIISEKQELIYQSHYNSHVLVIASNNELTLKIPIESQEEKFNNLGFSLNLDSLTNEQILKFVNSIPEKYELRDTFGGYCGGNYQCLRWGHFCEDVEQKSNGNTSGKIEVQQRQGCMLSSLEKVENARQNNRLRVSLYTDGEMYETESEAKNAIESILRKFDIEIPNYNIDYTQKTEYVIDTENFNWNEALRVELNWLEEIDAIDIGNKNIKDLSNLVRGNSIVNKIPDEINYLAYDDNGLKKVSLDKVENIDKLSWIVEGIWYISAYGNCDVKAKDDILTYMCHRCGPGATSRLELPDISKLEILGKPSVISQSEETLTVGRIQKKVNIWQKIINLIKNLFR